VQPALGDPAWAGGLDWVTHRGPFQPLIFCVILCDSAGRLERMAVRWLDDDFSPILSQKQTPFCDVNELRESCAAGRGRSGLELKRTKDGKPGFSLSASARA